MIFKINCEINKKLKNDYDIALKELNEFYGINWVRNLPRLFIVSDRKSIDALFGVNTESWVIGWSENNNIYVLEKSKFLNESNHKQYTDKDYAMLIKHEMSHSFSSILASGEVKPKWLGEGVAIYTSGQNSTHIRPTEFKKFLDYFDKGGKDVYAEAGFAVELLVEKFGKQKVLNLIKTFSQPKSRNDFNSSFKTIFGFEPTYFKFNILLTQK